MSRLKIHPEHHAASRIGWLRAAVLGANDGIVSTGSLIVGIAASGTDRSGVLLAGIPIRIIPHIEPSPAAINCTGNDGGDDEEHPFAGA